MKEFNYIIIGGGCAGLSLAYELEIHEKLKDKTLAIIEPREEYKRDKTWSFWKVTAHNFDDCIKKSWENFTVNIKNKTKHLKCNNLPYQSIDSGLFYKKINDKLKQNPNIAIYKNINDIKVDNSIIFNSVPSFNITDNDLWQHFHGAEIQTRDDCFDTQILNLMDFDCDQKDSVHFFYTLPFEKNKALIESTWLSDMKNLSEKEYDHQVKDYIDNHLNLKNYKIIYKEEGAIPLFYPSNIKSQNTINIGTAGGMTRLSTGYTFLNIQEHSKYIRKNIENITSVKIFQIPKKYKFLDGIFLKVLKDNPKKMPDIFFKIFNGSSKTTIRFLSNKSNIFEDISIILKMPKWIFIRALFR